MAVDPNNQTISTTKNASEIGGVNISEMSVAHAEAGQKCGLRMSTQQKWKALLRLSESRSEASRLVFIGMMGQKSIDRPPIS